MHIYSKFKDYYDSAVGMGRDPEIHYVRKQEKHEFTEEIGNWRTRNVSLMGFCGEIYPFLEVTEEVKVAGQFFPKKVTHFFYDVEEYLDSKFFIEKRASYFNRKPKEVYRDFWNKWSKHDDTLFLKFKAPIFVIENGKIFTNVKLTDYHFYKVIDPYTAFQEIQQYLSNQLVERKDPDVVEDKYRIAQHGFDKFSFRHPVKVKDLK